MGPGDDLGAALADHQAAARERRAREAETLGLGWLVEQPVVDVDTDAERPADTELV